MAAKKAILHDVNGDQIAPATSADMVFINETKTLAEAIENGEFGGGSGSGATAAQVKQINENTQAINKLSEEKVNVVYDEATSTLTITKGDVVTTYKLAADVDLSNYATATDMQSYVADQLSGVTSPTDEQVETAVNAWLEANPDATTTVADGSITYDKLSSEVVTKHEVVTNQDSCNYSIANLADEKSGYHRGQVYDPDTGEKIESSAGAYRGPFRVIGGTQVRNSKSVAGPNTYLLFFDKNMIFISALFGTTTATTYDIPDNAYYAVWESDPSSSSSAPWYTIGANDARSWYLSAYISEVYYAPNDMKIDYSDVLGTEAIDAAVEVVQGLPDDVADTVNITNEVFSVSPTILKANTVYKVRDGYFVAYPWSSSSSLVGSVQVFDKDMNFLSTGVYDATKTGFSRTDLQQTLSAFTYRDFFAIIDGKWRSGILDSGKIKNDALDLSATFTNDTGYNDFEARNGESIEPYYIKATFDMSFNIVVTETDDELDNSVMFSIKDNKSSELFVNQFAVNMQNQLLANMVSDISEINQYIKSIAIREANRRDDALRIASFNIFGAGMYQTNWDLIVHELKDYGIDVCGYQEVKNPSGNDPTGTGYNTGSGYGNKVFADTFGKSWLMPYCSEALDTYQTNERMVTSRFPITSGATEWEFSDWTNDHRFCYHTYVDLPNYKNRKGSENLKLSVYCTQLEYSKAMTMKHTAELAAVVAEDTSPFIVICGDFNENNPDHASWEALKEIGMTPAISIRNPTIPGTHWSVDNVFINKNMKSLHDDVIQSAGYKTCPPYSARFDKSSDHNLVFADVQMLYDNIFCVTQNLTNITSDFMNNWIQNDGSSLTITLTPDEGYEITSGTILMGEQENNRWADFYADGVITIDTPSHDITITVKAAATGGNNGYSNGYYNDSGVLTPLENNYVLDDYIEASGTVTLKYTGSATVTCLRVTEFDESYNFVKRAYVQSTTGTFTLDDSTTYIKIGVITTASDVLAVLNAITISAT